MNGDCLMSIYDEYQIIINEAQRRVIMRALTDAMANDRLSSKGGALSRPTHDEYAAYSPLQRD
jgi:monoamine oxidase